MKLVNLLKSDRWRAWRDRVSWKLKNRIHGAVLRRINLEWKLKSGIRIKVASLGDWAIYNDIFVEGEYDAAIQAAAQGSNTGALNVVDVGANVGFFTLRAAHLFLGAPAPVVDFRITCIEGSPTIHSELKRRIANSLAAAERTTVVHGLVGRREGSARIIDTPFHPMTTISKNATKGVEVGFINLESVLGQTSPIHLLKCDIEGAEEAFIENYPQLFSRTQLAIFEFHHDKCDTGRCRELLQRYGFNQWQVLANDRYTSLEFYSRTQPDATASSMP